MVAPNQLHPIRERIIVLTIAFIFSFCIRMSESLTSFENQETERRYDSSNDRLFLVYYALPSGYNRNNWGVTDSSIATNIHTAINKPVVVYRKNPSNSFHTHQAGNFVHPTVEEAAAELGHPPNAEEYYNWQEKFAIGRVRNVDKRDKGYAFTLEITDPEAKNILKSNSYTTGIPGWTSPQIISNARMHPDEERTGMFNHWVISHVALVDVPAYGFNQAAAKAKCFGVEKECLIQTRSASSSNLGFCVKQATIDLIDSRSSHDESQGTNSHNIMSQSENTTTKSSESITYPPAATDNTKPVNTTTEQPKEEQQTLPVTPTEEPKPQPIEGAKSLEEANAQIRQMSELLAETNKQLKNQQKELDRISLSEKKARLAFVIPRDLFKSDESHMKEVEKAMNEKVSESFLIDYWNTKRQLAMMQTTRKTEEPIVAKSASQSHDVPDFSSSQSPNVRSNIQKQLELQKMILEGGTN